MSYRCSTPSQKIAVCDVTSPIEIHLLNGTTSEIAIPCSYVVDGELVPIHLLEEGYANPVMAIAGTPVGFTWSATIDPEDDSIIRLVLDAECVEAVEVDLVRPFSLFITRTLEDLSDRTDAVIRGALTIVAAPLPA